MQVMEDKDRSYQGVHMLKGVLALWYYCAKSKKSGVKCGYEKLLQETPESLFNMSEFFLRKMSKNNPAVEKEFFNLTECPEKYLDRIETAGAFHKQELAFFKIGKIAQYTPVMFKQDKSLRRCGICSHYLSRKIIIDRYIRDAIARGFTQVAIQACGLDTAAERFAKDNPNVHFYLSDLPVVMQERLELEDWKFRTTFFGSKGQLANLHYGTADLEKPGTLIKMLTSTKGFDGKKKTLYVFEGVSMYLTTESIRRLFYNFSTTTPEHEIIIGFMFHSTEAEMRTVQGIYKNKAALPYYKIQTEFFRGDATHPAYSMKGLPGPDSVFGGLVDWEKTNEDYLVRHKDSGLTVNDLQSAIIAYQTLGGYFLLISKGNMERSIGIKPNLK
jgi:hypothetical protein